MKNKSNICLSSSFLILENVTILIKKLPISNNAAFSAAEEVRLLAISLRTLEPTHVTAIETSDIKQTSDIQHTSNLEHTSDRHTSYIRHTSDIRHTSNIIHTSNTNYFYLLDTFPQNSFGVSFVSLLVAAASAAVAIISDHML